MNSAVVLGALIIIINQGVVKEVEAGIDVFHLLGPKFAWVSFDNTFPIFNGIVKAYDVTQGAKEYTQTLRTSFLPPCIVE